jgi:putative transposase
VTQNNYMTSPEAILYDTFYHIYNRGNNRENIFIEDRNYEYFLKLYVRYIEPVADTFAYCLLRNHFHILLRTKSEGEIPKTLIVSKTFRVSNQFSNFFNAYAKAINQAYGRAGSLFQNPFGRAALTESNPFERVVVYIHRNPQKHGFVADFRDWKYSSYHALLSEGPTHLRRNEVLDWFGSRKLFVQVHDQWDTEGDPKGLQDL